VRVTRVHHATQCFDMHHLTKIWPDTMPHTLALKYTSSSRCKRMAIDHVCMLKVLLSDTTRIDAIPNTLHTKIWPDTMPCTLAIKNTSSSRCKSMAIAQACTLKVLLHGTTRTDATQTKTHTKVNKNKKCTRKFCIDFAKRCFLASFCVKNAFFGHLATFFVAKKVFLDWLGLAIGMVHLKRRTVQRHHRNSNNKINPSLN